MLQGVYAAGCICCRVCGIHALVTASVLLKVVYNEPPFCSLCDHYLLIYLYVDCYSTLKKIIKKIVKARQNRYSLCYLT